MDHRPFGLDPVQAPMPHHEIFIGGDEIQQLWTRKQEHIGEDEWSNVVSTAVKILAGCPDPSGPPATQTGLAVGKVQSGKTLSYTSLIALAIDNGYRITVVLAGVTKNVLGQTYERLCRDLNTPRDQLTPFQNPTLHQVDTIRSVLHVGGHALIVLLKNHIHLNNIRELLSSQELCSHPTLIIDDEGDQASLNNQFRRDRVSSTYNRILQLRNVLPRHAYIAYTATPQANLLLPSIDGLSPDFGVLVEPGSGYCGGSVFFGQNRDRYVRLLPHGEGDHGLATGVPDGLRLAIATFFVAATIRHLKGEAAGISMIIHSTERTTQHSRLVRAVRFLIEKWRGELTLPDSDPAADDVLRLLRQAYDDLCTTVQGPPTWEEVSQRLRNEIWLVEIRMVNSLPLAMDPINTPFRFRNNILIGGNMLGRGVTIEGLAITYMTRRARGSTNADTMEQRARWFGYKEDYLDLCRIFMPSQLQDNFTDLLYHEDDFWEALRRNERQGIPMRDWPRMFSLDMVGMGIRPTRSSVADFYQFRGTGWSEQRKILDSPTLAERNIEVARQFFRQHPGELCQFGNVEHIVVPSCPVNDVISDLFLPLNLEGTGWEKEYFIEYLNRLLYENPSLTMDVLHIVRGEPRERSCSQDGRINELMQGYTPNMSRENPRFYRGDRNIHEDRWQLQIHMILPKFNDIPQPSLETPVLAIYIPDEPTYNLEFVVRAEPL